MRTVRIENVLQEHFKILFEEIFLVKNLVKENNEVASYLLLLLMSFGRLYCDDFDSES